MAQLHFPDLLLRRSPLCLQNDIRLVYKKIEEGADVNFVFGKAYGTRAVNHIWCLKRH